jgi:2,4-dienoyl-CoA reductase-like NADH-dependent reductase (Old Yellow Enzyme family)
MEGMQMETKGILLSPIKIGTRTCVNRFFVQAMEGNDADVDGNPTDLTYQRYENLFRGESGLVSLEAISITDESKSRKNQMMIMPRNLKSLTNFVGKLREVNKDTIFIFQLTHSGELSKPDFSRRVCVKPLPGYGGDVLTDEELEQIMQQYVVSAKIAYEAGADGVDLKLCHGYLGSQILRPYNDRPWKYGGSWENRRQFAFDLFERIQEEIKDKNFLIGAKISVWEGFPGGFGSAGIDSPVLDLTEPIDLIKGLEERGAHYFIPSAGSPSITINLTQVDKSAPYFAYLHTTFSKAFKDNLKPETVVIGSNYSVYRNGKNGLFGTENSTILNVGAQNIQKGITDMIGLGRQSFADPMLPLKVRNNQEEDINYCTVCDNCLELLIQQSQIGCCTYNKYYTNVLVETRQEKGKLKVSHT